MAAGDLTTSDAVKAWLNSQGVADDGNLEGWVSAYSQAVQSWLSRTIASASYSPALDGHGTRRILLENYPITAVASLAVDGVSIPAASGPPYCSGYVFNAHSVSLYGYCFTVGYGNIQINYTAGYSSVPTDIAQACIEWLADGYRSRDRIGMRSKSLAGSEVAGYAIVPMPPRVKMLLQPYKRVAPL
jgi:hypothetical protein